MTCGKFTNPTKTEFSASQGDKSDGYYWFSKVTIVDHSWEGPPLDPTMRGCYLLQQVNNSTIMSGGTTLQKTYLRRYGGMKIILQFWRGAIAWASSGAQSWPLRGIARGTWSNFSHDVSKKSKLTWDSRKTFRWVDTIDNRNLIDNRNHAISFNSLNSRDKPTRILLNLLTFDLQRLRLQELRHCLSQRRAYGWWECTCWYFPFVRT